MKKIVSIIQEKYKILIPVFVGVVLLIAMFFLYKEYEYDNTRNKKEVSVYQYFLGSRDDYTAIVTYNLRDSIVDLAVKDEKQKLTSTPVYYKDEKKVIFPNEMNIVFPRRDGSQYRLYKYATYYVQDDVHFIKNNTDLGNYEYFFMYDGNDLFFFPYESTLYLNDKEYMKLGPMSYVRVVGGDSLVYYDTATESGDVVELDGEVVTAVNGYINVNVSRKKFKLFEKDVMFFDINNLNPLFKTIDK